MNLVLRYEMPCNIIFLDAIRFKNKKIYNFKTNIKDLKRGDIVLVNTIQGNHTAIFMEYNYSEKAKEKAIKKVLLKLDYSIIKGEGKSI